MNPRIFKGKTVEEATEEALKTLKKDLENLEIKIINTGRTGILGLGGHPAEIEVYIIGEPIDAISDQDESPPRKITKPRPSITKNIRKPQQKKETVKKTFPKKNIEKKVIENIPTEKDPEVEEAVGKILSNIINSAGLDTDVYVRDQMEEGSIVFELEGKDSGLLIGRRGETLSSIEYLVRLIASKNLDKRANVMIDVEDYRLRRKEKLSSIANSTAEKVINTGKRISLEPMSASDRRIIHMTLADNSQINTQSRGEGLQRKVVINPND
tara:strand:- start:415 stop:1221 length:807 start_codon:yes stop_codon:yes gene_type:complete